jgi:hypothetical protein
LISDIIFFWNLWKCRNLILFDNGNGAVTEIVEAVKISSWKWWMSRSNAAHCLLYEWRAEPRLCITTWKNDSGGGSKKHLAAV